ncbi:MAG: CDP-alcohol phosphatidyltransferase family protein [Candidatus Aenigmarchaeota archaeon]|nr:CDP-alcohol phosphatidyltransferase family protein [Candidatus Aenigmarchaeota archaeon]
MVLAKRRDRFANFSVKVGLAFSKLPLSANQWTMLSLVPILFALYFLVNGQFLLAAGLFLLSAFMDLIDGSVARVTGTVSKKGAYLDTVVDRYVEGIIILGLLFAGLPDFYLPVTAWLFVYFFGAMMTTYVKAAAKEKDLTEKELCGGFLERAERLLILFVGILVASLDPFYLTYTIVVLAVLSNITVLQRVWAATREKK